MDTKPNYEELEQKVSELQKDAIKRTQIEEALRKSERKYKLLFERAPLGYQSLDEKGHFLEVNRAWLDTFGYTREEVIGKSFSSFIHPAWVEHFKRNFDRFKAVGEILGAEFQMTKKDGSFIMVAFNGKISRDKKGNVKQTYCILRDITSQKRYEKALRESERMLNETQTLAKVGGWEYHVEKKSTAWTDEVYRIYGLDRESYNPNNMNQNNSFYAPEDRKTVGRAFYSAVVKGEPYDLESGFVSAEGHHIWVRTTAKPVFKNGNVTKVVGNIMDITERKRAEEMLLAERLKLERYFENIPLMAFNFSFNGRIADCNTNAVNALGYEDKEELLGKSAISTLYTPRSQKKAKQIFETWKKGKRIKNEELEVINRQGKIIDVLLNVDTVFDQDGSPIHSIATHLDITERKRAHKEKVRLQAELQQAQKTEAIATLAGGIAHDYNNLLSVIMGNLSLAMEKAGLEPELAEFLDDANRASLKVRDLTHELMALSKGGGPVKKMGSLKEFLRSNLETIPTHSGISLNTSISKDLWQLPFDPLKMGAVFRNVMTNAFEAMPDGGIITIKAENFQIEDTKWNPGLTLEPGDYVHISIQDQGVGISKEHLSKIFDPYFSTKALGVQKGMGLGLATTYAIVEKHGGHISFDSSPGTGTTVNIYLPVESEAGERKDPGDTNPNTPSSIRRVLVMDDEEMLRKLAQQMLKRLGYEVKTVKDGFEAIEAVRNQKDSGAPFDMVIVDLTIKGGMGGEQTIRELLKIDPHIKTIVSSGYFNDPIMRNYEEYGFMGSMAKPYELHNLKKAIEKLPNSLKFSANFREI
ncbi:MAG: PAS domain S-box protein [Deltaproteobacteria bacterium]|nr:PAS domain S-box protein [Deltaproteobacteria bacterium]